MDLSIIIVNYKTKDKTLACLQAIEEAGLGALAYEIIVVDNASGDDLSPLAEAYPRARVIQSASNLGMGGGNNLGAREAKGDFILVLNPDTRVRPGAIEALHGFLRARPEVGIAGPKLLNPDGSLQYSCLRFPKLHTPILRRTFLGRFAPAHLDNFLMKDFDHAETREVDWLMGSCLLVRREILDRDGRLFDEKYFMYFEDTDLCRRAQRKHNYKVAYHPAAEVFHDHARESAANPWYRAPLVDPLAREHLKSWFKYFFK